MYTFESHFVAQRPLFDGKPQLNGVSTAIGYDFLFAIEIETFAV
jgi:hypothetical protein